MLHKPRKMKADISRICLVVFAAFALGLNGCEDNADEYKYNMEHDVSALNIRPPSATLNAGDGWEVFSAVGGVAPYRWSVSDESLGVLDTNVAVTVVYNRIGDRGGVNIINVRDANEWVAEARIRHTTDVIVGPTSVTDSAVSY